MSETKPSPERDVRDRLAEALFRSCLAPEYEWATADEAQRAMWCASAGGILAALPSVGLTIGRGGGMSNRVYRVQGADGRGPFAPGRSRLWADDKHTAGMTALPTWIEEFGPDLINREGRPGEVFGCATRTTAGLARWFSPTERQRLSALGYNPVAILPGRIIAESPHQVVFARYAPLTRGVVVIPWSDVLLAEAA